MSCARSLKSHRSRAQKIALLMGGTLSKTEINGFQHCVDLLACSDNAARNVGFVGNEITLLRALPTKFNAEFHEDGLRGSPGPGRGLIAPSGPDRVPIAPSGPHIGARLSQPRQLYQAGIAQFC